MPQWQTVTSDGTASVAEDGFITVENNEGDELEPGEVVEFSLTTTDADQGLLVELVDTAVNLTTGIGAPIAGVVETTISTGDVGRVQIMGAATVRASASLAAATLVVASSINATNIGHVEASNATTAVGVAYNQAVLGYNMENGPNATQARVYLKL